ncbi:MAG: hypothetical protein GF383_08960 [Candidatus Lokiarchaeota archaeon]|nr:hypothetical protein [Candidatus Lokiarchaeota archaeon]MBD3340564.1 hypothetical protein [Candidatus Lokiarchaeota archaeon]
MSATTKQLFVNIKDLSFKSEQLVTDLNRFLTEALPQISITRNGNEFEVKVSSDFSNRILKLRIKKFLHKKEINNDFRPISYNDPEKDGYIVKERRIVEIPYY